ncbi:MAG TPA: acyl-CoA dehydrogenase family protein [Actinomycetota bacterium]
MDFDFSDEQRALAAEARRFLREQCPAAHVREFIDDPAGWSRGLWKQMADLGWTGLPFGEAHGGLGLGYLDVVLLFDELGRALAPVPYLSSMIAGLAIARAGSDEQRDRLLPAIASGEKVGALVADEVVLDAPCADVFVVIDGENLHLVEDGFTVEPKRGFDLTRPVGTVSFGDGAREPMPGPAAIARRFAVASVCAEMVGVATKATELSVAYAKEREQFGRPIGSFQAIKHELAEMAAEVDAARAAVAYACWAVDTGAPDADTAISVAKSYASDACGHAAGEAIQVHGGIGYTWEHDVHLYTRRVKSLEAVYGDAAHHRERLAVALGL